MLTKFPNGVSSFGIPVLGGIGGIPFTGNYFFVDPANGSDGAPGEAPDEAKETLGSAHDRCVAGNNDVVVLIGDGHGWHGAIIGNACVGQRRCAFDRRHRSRLRFCARTDFPAQRSRFLAHGSGDGRWVYVCQCFYVSWRSGGGWRVLA